MPPGSEPAASTRDEALSRRGLLLAVAGVGTATTLAGCGAISTYEFGAAPVVLPRRSRRRLGFEETLREPVTDERSRIVGGVQVQATVESHVAVYEPTLRTGRGDSPGSDGRRGAVTPSVGVVSTPRAAVLGRSFNPLARLSLPNLLTSDVAGGFLRRAGLDRVGEPREKVWWERGPAFLADHECTCVGAPATIESYAGVLGGDPATVAFVHLARVTARSVVLVAAVHGRTVEDLGAPFVGPAGYLSRDEFGEVVSTVADVCGALRYVG